MPDDVWAFDVQWNVSGTECFASEGNSVILTKVGQNSLICLRCLKQGQHMVCRTLNGVWLEGWDLKATRAIIRPLLRFLQQ